MSDRAVKPSVASEWGLACPGCTRDDSIEVEFRVWATLSVDGTEIVETDHEWDHGSRCRCTACGHNGPVRDFTIDDQNQQQA